MQFYKQLYISEGIKDKKKKICYKLKTKPGLLSVYVITLAKGSDQLEVYHCVYLRQKYYKKNPPFIIGIGENYDATIELVRKITDETFVLHQYNSIKEMIIGTTQTP